jgi:hypothetical protein
MLRAIRAAKDRTSLLVLQLSCLALHWSLHESQAKNQLMISRQIGKTGILSPTPTPITYSDNFLKEELPNKFGKEGC